MPPYLLSKNSEIIFFDLDKGRFMFDEKGGTIHYLWREFLYLFHISVLDAVGTLSATSYHRQNIQADIQEMLPGICSGCSLSPSHQSLQNRI